MPLDQGMFQAQFDPPPHLPWGPILAKYESSSIIKQRLFTPHNQFSFIYKLIINVKFVSEACGRII